MRAHRESPHLNAEPRAAPAESRRKAKFLTVVWGEAYIRRFATLSLPSFLAPGNLPALAEATALEVVIMTRREDVGYFETHRAFQRLRTICPVRFVEIDDLITTGNYGVTLTLAYARPVIACGREMLDTHFVFMNADFVLADGSLRSLARHIVAGRSIVLGPSFRATAEAVEPHLEVAVDPGSGVLAIPPRELTALSLPHPHPTTTAKIVNQSFCHSLHPNQFFWQVDGALLGRYYLIFMLCLRPERLIDSINCFCDYAFIPELCPSGDEVAMGDSDEFFMLELQSQAQEMHLLQLGGPKDWKTARSLSQWTTAEHRRAAHHDIVFHAADIPPQIEAAKAEARAFVARIERRLRRPVPHAKHRYWIRAVQAWRQYRRAQGLSASPRELAPPAGGLLVMARRTLWTIAYTARLRLVGDWPRVTPLHPLWMDLEHLRDALASIPRSGAPVLIVRSAPHALDPIIPRGVSAQFATPEALLTGQVAAREGGFAHVFLYLLRPDCRNAQYLVAQCEALLRPGGVCTAFIHDLHAARESADFSGELVTHVEDILGWPLRPALCSFVGGRLKRFAEKFLRLLDASYSRWGLWAFPVSLPVVGVWLSFMLLENLGRRWFMPSRHFVPNCSSVAMRLTPSALSAPKDGAVDPARDLVQRGIAAQ